MGSSYTQVPHSKFPGSNKPTVKTDLPGIQRDKKPLIPVHLDITRTKEFWKNAVWS